MTLEAIVKEKSWQEAVPAMLGDGLELGQCGDVEMLQVWSLTTVYLGLALAILCPPFVSDLASHH